MGTEGGNRGVWRRLLLVIGTVPAAVGWLLALVDHTRFFEVGLVGMFLGTGTAAILILRGARVHPDREAMAWRLVGTGFLIAAATVGVTGVLASAGALPVFGPHDLAFLSAYSFAIVGFLLMPHVGGVQSRVRIFLDGAIGAISLAILLVVFFLPGIRAHLAGATFWERFAGIGYPLLDSLMVVVGMIVTIRRSAWRFDVRIVALGTAMGVQALADLQLLSSGIGESLTAAQPDFRFFLAAVLLQLVTASQIRRRMKPKEYADRRQPIWAMVAPYGAMAVALLVVVRQVWLSNTDSNIALLLGMALGTVALVVVRQLVALRDYRSLVSEQRRGLVSSVSHELRTPLTAMVGFLEVLDDTTIELGAKERKELISIVRQQSLYMSRIVADLLLLAREANTLQLEESQVSVAKLVDESARRLARADRDLEVKVESDLEAYADPDRLRQALDNLIVNAFRYGGGRVLVVGRAEASDVVIEVHDNGQGVPRKYELAIWEQFERGANRLNASTPGSGIGLSVVDLVVRRHGGTASYERSRLLGGACFRLVLPDRVRSQPSTSAVPIRAVRGHLAS
ncbi:MAG TPA: ATP-binding protein [Acidimicrobiia bacterium]|nr:ATP-binding protein [Acidimicrobiia bacterium]